MFLTDTSKRTRKEQARVKDKELQSRDTAEGTEGSEDRTSNNGQDKAAEVVLRRMATMKRELTKTKTMKTREIGNSCQIFQVEDLDTMQERRGD